MVFGERINRISEKKSSSYYIITYTKADRIIELEKSTMNTWIETLLSFGSLRLSQCHRHGPEKIVSFNTS